jgi:hypothetical protein
MRWTYITEGRKFVLGTCKQKLREKSRKEHGIDNDLEERDMMKWGENFGLFIFTGGGTL